MAKVIKAPNEIPYYDRNKRTIFLAGSIDMGSAVDWQKEVEERLADSDVVILNPRRDDWDSTWVQDISNEKFSEQVSWEISHIEDADLVIYYFDPKGQAPITLLELGLKAGQRYACDKMIVCCPPGYWRRGNVQVVCKLYDIPLVDTLDQLIEATKEWLETYA